MVITSKDNETIKHIKKLKERKFREEYNEFVIEGPKMIEEAINEKVKIKTVVICDDCRTSGFLTNELMYEVAKFNCIYTSEKVFNSITDVVNHQGIIAVVEKSALDEIKIDYKSDVFLLLDTIQDPGNMGTILRTADSLDINQIIVSENTADIFNPKVVRATMGAIFRVRVIKVDSLAKIVKEMKKRKINIYATDLQTDKSIYDVDYKKTAIVIGNESNGVSEEILQLANTKIKIPMTGKTESLNAAVATGIILYEAFKSNGIIK